MNTLPPNEPLDDQEREFARILHALPSGEPSPALDAKILRAATNAAASSKRPVRRMLASAGALWGIGSAAAAVLALGVAWQMKYGGADHSYVSRAPQAQAVSDSAEEDSVAVELSSQPADAPFVPPPPPPPMEAAKPVPMPSPASPKLRAPPQAQPGRAAAAAAPAAAEPEAFARDHLDEHVSQAGDDRSVEANALAAKEAAAQQARSEAQMELKAKTEDNERERAARMASNAAAAPPPPPVAAAAAPTAPAAAAAESAAGGRADAGYTSGSLSTRAQADKNEAEANRKPATWLADIRKLRDQGRLDEARASLVEFRKKYPKWVIPTDLAPLQPE